MDYRRDLAKSFLVIALAIALSNASLLMGYCTSIASAEVLSAVKLTNVSVSIVRIGEQEGAYYNGQSKLLLRLTAVHGSNILAEADLTSEYYGSRIFTKSSLDVIQDTTGAVLILFQARRGGDGDHTENRLHVYRYADDRLTKLAEQNIFDAKLIYIKDAFSHIEGKVVITLCNVCDGWESSTPEDIFIIPISLSFHGNDGSGSVVNCLLSNADKQTIIRRFETQKESNIRDQLSYGNKRYLEYVSEISRVFYSIVN